MRKSELEKLTIHVFDMATSIKEKSYAVEELSIYTSEQIEEMKRIDMKMMIVLLLKEMQDWTENKVAKIIAEISKEYHSNAEYLDIMLTEKIKLYHEILFQNATIIKYLCLVKLKTWFNYSEDDIYATII